MSAAPDEQTEHETLQLILAEIELRMLRGEMDRVSTLLAQVDQLLEPRWPLTDRARQARSSGVVRR